MADTLQPMTLLTLMGILTTTAIAIVGAFIKRLHNEMDKKVPVGEYEEYRKNMTITVTNLQRELDQGHETFKNIHGQLASMNLILTAIAVKMEVTDIDKIIKHHVEGNH